MDWLGASPTWGQLIIVYAFLFLISLAASLAKGYGSR